MTRARNEFGIVGLGRMGGNLALQALEKGMRVVGFDLHEPIAGVAEAGLVRVKSSPCVAMPAPVTPARGLQITMIFMAATVRLRAQIERMAPPSTGIIAPVM